MTFSLNTQINLNKYLDTLIIDYLRFDNLIIKLKANMKYTMYLEIIKNANIKTTMRLEINATRYFFIFFLLINQKNLFLKTDGCISINS